MKLWNKLQARLRKSPRARSIALYLFFVIISAVFWSFLTFNRDVQLDMEVPVEMNLPDNVHLLSKVPDTITVTVQDRGYRFFTYLFNKTPTLKLRFGDYSDGNSNFKVEHSQLKKALGHVLNKNATIVNVLPESINIKYTDLPGKKVPVRTDIVVEPRENYTLNGALIQSQDSVLVFSDAKTLSEINEVYTYHVEEVDLSDTLRRRVTIAPINGAVVEPHLAELLVADVALHTIVVGHTGVQRLLGIGDAVTHETLAVAVLVGSAVLPTVNSLTVRRHDGVGQFVVNENLELMTPVFGVTVRIPCENQTVVGSAAVNIHIINRHRTIWGDRIIIRFQITHLRVFVPVFPYIIYRVCMFGLVFKTSVDERTHILAHSPDFIAVAVDDPLRTPVASLEIAVADIPFQRYRARGLLE